MVFGKNTNIDMFDHKGPIIFFIDKIGFMLGGGYKRGVSIVPMLCMCFTLTAIFNISQLMTNSNKYAFLSTVLTLLALKINYIEGNSVEEYCLPFLCWYFYGLEKWFMGERKEHKTQWAFLYGITAGVCLFTRVTNVVPICGGIIVIVVYLLYKKEIVNLLKNALFFVFGFIAILAPFIIYFAIKGGLSEMLYATFFYNLEYASKSDSWLKNITSGRLREFFKRYFLYYLLIPVIILHIYGKEYLSSIALGLHFC